MSRLYNNSFKDGPSETNKKPASTVYNSATGKHEKKKKSVKGSSWSDIIRGTAPASLRKRKKKVDKAVKKAS